VSVSPLTQVAFQRLVLSLTHAVSFGLLADIFRQQPPTALSWMEALGISNQKEWTVNSVGESSFISTEGIRRNIHTNYYKTSAQKKEAAQHVIDVQKDLDTLLKIIPCMRAVSPT
jgi:hypothetical protein